MKKHVIVKQTNLGTKEQNVLFKGYLELSTGNATVALKYLENDQRTMVHLIADGHALHLTRRGEMVSELHFQEKKTTKGSIRSEYGTIELEIFTHKYIQKDNIIAMEYDVLVQGEVTERFRFLCTMKEVMA